MESEDKEIWHWVVGYEGLYMVSNLGRIMSLPKATTYGRIISQRERPKGSGYMTVELYKDNKGHSARVHRLVAQAFIPNVDRKPEVNHKNGVRSDNRVENLEWVTRSENELHAYRELGKKPNRPWAGKPRLFARKLTDEQVEQIRKDTRPSSQIAREYDVSKTTICSIKNGKIYKETYKNVN